MFRTLRAVDSRNPHPLLFGRTFAYQTSRQAQTYLLCRECEDRFHHRGENWTLANCYRRLGLFKLRGTLEQAVPLHRDEDITIYSAATIPDIDSDALAYFGMSVFWRAAVHSWRLDERRIGIDLGPYEQTFRRYLMGEAGFPANTALSLLVGSESRMVEWALNPQSTNENGFHHHNFTIPGITFMLFVGGRLPAEYITASFAPAEERLIAIHPKAEQWQLSRLIGDLRRARGNGLSGGSMKSPASIAGCLDDSIESAS